MRGASQDLNVTAIKINHTCKVIHVSPNLHFTDPPSRHAHMHPCKPPHPQYTHTPTHSPAAIPSVAYHLPVTWFPAAQFHLWALAVAHLIILAIIHDAGPCFYKPRVVIIRSSVSLPCHRYLKQVTLNACLWRIAVPVYITSWHEPSFFCTPSR